MMGRRLTAAMVTAAVLSLFTVIGTAYAAYTQVPREGTWVPNDVVYAIAVHGDRVYIGGSFTAVRDPATGVSVARTRLAAFDATTGALVTTFRASADKTVRALAVSEDGSTLYAGGDFLSVNGSPRARIAALDTNDGDLTPGWNASARGQVRDLVVKGDALFAAGKFATPGGFTRVGIARFDTSSSGGVVSSWKTWTGQGRVMALALSADGSKLVAGGTFKIIDGVVQSFLASVSVADGRVTSWRPPVVCDTCWFLDVAVNGGDVYGAMGGPGGQVGAWDAGLNVLHWKRRADGDVQAIAYHEGVVYAGGHFGPIFHGLERHQLAAFSASGGAPLDFAPSFTGSDWPGVWALAAGPDYLRVGGGFRGFTTGTAARYAEFPYF